MDPTAAATAVTSGASSGNTALVLAGVLLLALIGLGWFLRRLAASVDSALNKSNVALEKMPGAMKAAVKEANDAHTEQFRIISDAHERETAALHDQITSLLTLASRRCPIESQIAELAGRTATMRDRIDDHIEQESRRDSQRVR